MRRPAVLWALAAVVGIVVVAGMTLAASRLSTLQVGLASEPLQAGQALAPAPPAAKATPAAKAKPKPEARKHRKRAQPAAPLAAPPPAPAATPAPAIVATATPQPVAPAPTVDDYGGSSGRDDHGSGGHGSDD